MNKRLILSILFLSSCVNHEYQQMFNIAKANIVGIDDIKIDQDFLADRNYSFIKVKQGKSTLAILTLLSIKGDEYVWVGLDNVRIRTKNGRIIETFGLDHNFSIVNKINLPDHDDLNDISILVKLDNPLATFPLSMSYQSETSEVNLDKKYKVVEVKEIFKSSSAFKWKGENFYWYDVNNNLPIKVSQQTHPFLGPFVVEFYYKFN